MSATEKLVISIGELTSSLGIVILKLLSKPDRPINSNAVEEKNPETGGSLFGWLFSKSTAKLGSVWNLTAVLAKGSYYRVKLAWTIVSSFYNAIFFLKDTAHRDRVREKEKILPTITDKDERLKLYRDLVVMYDNFCHEQLSRKTACSDLRDQFDTCFKNVNNSQQKFSVAKNDLNAKKSVLENELESLTLQNSEKQHQRADYIIKIVQMQDQIKDNVAISEDERRSLFTDNFLDDIDVSFGEANRQENTRTKLNQCLEELEKTRVDILQTLQKKLAGILEKQEQIENEILDFEKKVSAQENMNNVHVAGIEISVTAGDQTEKLTTTI